MGSVRLTAVTRTQGNNEALTSGDIRPAGFDLDFQDVPVLVHAFRRMVRELAYDVSEMAFTTYVCAREHGVPIIALPVFLARGFHHGALYGPSPDWEGKRIAVNRGYTVTTGVWARGILADEYGVDLSRVAWMPTGDEHVEAYRAPANVLPLPRGADLGSLIAAGGVQGAVGFDAPPPGLTPLIPDARTAGFDALAQRGLYPINHLIVVRSEVLLDYPGLAVALFDAFSEAKLRYVERLRAGTGDTATDEMYKAVMEITGSDPLPYGIAPNLAMITQLLDHAHRQGIIKAVPTVASLFAAETHSLVS